MLLYFILRLYMKHEVTVYDIFLCIGNTQIGLIYTLELLSEMLSVIPNLTLTL